MKRGRPVISMHPAMDQLITDLRRIRRVRMVTRGELSKLTGIDPSTLSKMELKKLKFMNFWTLSKWANALNYEFQVSLKRKS